MNGEEKPLLPETPPEAPLTAPEEPLFSFKQNLLLFRRAVGHYKYVILVLSLGVSLAAYVYCKFQIPLYFSQASLLIEPVAPPEAGEIVEFRVERWEADNTLFTERDVVKSHLVAERAVQKLELNQVEPFKHSPNPVAQLLGLMRVEVSSRSRIITVGIRFADPVWAAKLVEGIVKAYIEISEEKERSYIERTVDQMRQEIASIQTRLAQDRQRLKEYEAAHPQVTTKEGLEGQLKHLTEELAAVSGEKVKLRTELEELASFIQQGYDVREHPRIAKDPSVQQVLTTLEQKKVELTQFLNIYKERFPLVAEKKAEVAQLEKFLGERKDQIVEELKSRYVLLATREQELKETITEKSEELSGLLEEVSGYEKIAGEVEISKNLYTLMLERINKAAILGRSPQVKVKVINPPQVPKSPTWPNTGRAVFFAFFGSLAAGAYGALLFFLLLKPIESEEEIVQGLRIPVLAEIPLSPQAKEAPEELIVDQGEGFGKDALVLLSTRLVAGGERSLLITSARPSEGKTYLVRNLGVFLARQGWRVLLVGSDFRDLHLKDTLEIDVNGQSIEAYMEGKCTEEELIHPCPEPRLFFLSPEHVLDNSLEVITADRFQALVRRITNQYDFVLFDSPPFQLFPDTELLAQTVKNVILVVRSGETPLHAVSKTVASLEKAGVHVTGSILNGRKLGWPRYYYYRYYYGYGEVRGPKRLIRDLIEGANQYVSWFQLLVEKRRFVRVKTAILVEFTHTTTKGDKLVWRGAAMNISEGGMLGEYWEQAVTARLNPSELNLLELKLKLPNQEPILTQGKVLRRSRIRRQVHLGIEFVNLSEADRERVRKLVESIRTSEHQRIEKDGGIQIRHEGTFQRTFRELKTGIKNIWRRIKIELKKERH